jgi:hypothetical protein
MSPPLLTLIAASFLFAAAPVFVAVPGRADTLPVPQNLIAFDSQEGHRLLQNSKASVAFYSLSEQFVTQKNQSFCGVASTVMVLNALHMPAPASAELSPYSAFDQDNVFTAKTEAAVPRSTIERQGLTLDQLGALARASGLTVEVHHAADTNLDAFRRDMSRHLATPGQFVLINFLRSAINEKSGGHISPLAAYDADSDRFLVLDVSRYKYPPVWVKASELFAAMNTRDPVNQGRSRGYVVLTR